MKKSYLLFLCALLLSLYSSGSTVISVADFGLKPSTGQNATPYVIKALEACRNVKDATLFFPKGKYDFYPDKNCLDTLFISAHDHCSLRYQGIRAVGFNNLTIDGNGSDFMYHKYMLPLVLIDCIRPVVKNFSIDFEKPNFTQAKIIGSTPESAIVEFAPSEDYSVENGRVYITDDSIKLDVGWMNEFMTNGKMLAWNTADQGYKKAEDIGNRKVKLYGMYNQPIPGNVLFLRNGCRPNPGILSWRCKDMIFQNINIYWAQGMGSIAQRCENISMDNVNIKLRKGSERYFTTIDALHFTSCKGVIKVENGLYENMLDDAINIHGDYLQITNISDDRKTIKVAYKHSQSFGYEAAETGEHIQYIAAETMLTSGKGKVKKSTRLTDYVTELVLNAPLPNCVKLKDCIENVDWTPEIVYRNNLIRNNRARGALFSSPRKSLVEGNTFDHCSGSAILISSDCNQWFLSGACQNLIIRNNVFNHCMTSFFQYCETVISIYPELPKMAEAYHRNIRIENNTFTLFEPAVLYAKSVDKLVFTGNKLIYEPKYKPILKPNTPLFNLVNCTNVKIKNNDIASELKNKVSTQ